MGRTMPRHQVVAAQPGRPYLAERPGRPGKALRVTVVGGGIAGMAAATVLAERGVRVTLFESSATVGGRAGAWPQVLTDGATVAMEHGFHAFFRHYHNLRALLFRVGVRLVPVPDYPVISPRWPDESFGGLPRRPPWSLMALVLRSKSIGWRDLIRMDGRAAAPLLAYDRDRTYAELDTSTAADLLDSLRLPARARAMLFDVFSHSFFNAEGEMSAAELVQMFHFYFLGNPEGLLFDVPDGDYAAALWRPWRAHLEERGAELETGHRVRSLRRRPGGWDVDGHPADAVVVACDIPGLQQLAGGTALEPLVAPLTAAPPYAVLRLWADRDCSAGRAPFAGVSEGAALDSISLYHRLEAESARWAGRLQGGVYELHAYALDEVMTPEEAKRRMIDDLTSLYPETAGMRVVDSHWRVARDCPGFPPGSDAHRPGVMTGVPDLYLAGDFVKLAFPSALMERAAASGVLAANAVLTRAGAGPEPVWSVPPRGLLTRWSRPVGRVRRRA